MKYLLTLALSLIMLCHITSQDLITQTQEGIQIESIPIGITANPLAKKFSNKDLKSIHTIDLFTVNDTKSLKSKIDDHVDGAVVLELNEKEFNNFLTQNKGKDDFKIKIPVDQKHSFELLITRSQALSDDFVLETSDGEKIPYQEKGVFFNGIITGKPKSFATVSIQENYLRIICSDEKGNYVLTKLEGTTNNYILFNDFNVKAKRDVECFTDEHEYDLSEKLQPVPQSEHSLKVRNNVEVYVEADYDLYVANGSNVTNTMNFMLDLFRESVSVFENESISLRLNRVLIWTTNNDPFNNIGGDSDLLADALDDWSCDYDVDDADIAHYISTESGATNIIGRADGIGEFCDLNDDGICGNDDTSRCATLGMSVPYLGIDPNAGVGFVVSTWTLSTFCHEMGHVFGGLHTHGCYWNGNDTQIDDCGNGGMDPEGASCYNAANPIIPSNGGTVMSYCQTNFSKGFNSQPGNVIRNLINSSSCIGNYESACPEIETIENAVSDSGIYDAASEILIHDANVVTGVNPTFSGSDQTIIYGNFSCPQGAGMRITLTGCN